VTDDTLPRSTLFYSVTRHRQFSVPGFFIPYHGRSQMVEPGAPRNLKRVWIGVLILVVVAWIIYAVSGGPSTPVTETGPSPATQSP
jgi:hypothetical protein